MAFVPPKTDAPLPTVVVTGTRGSSVSYTFNDTSLYDWWQSFEPSQVDRGWTPEESTVPTLVLPPPPEEPTTVVVQAPLPPPLPAIAVGPAAPQEADLPFVVVSAAKPKPAPKPPRPRPRRSKPAPKPSRRTRPLPTRRGPRIPIEVPALVRFSLGRLAGVLALVPALFEALKNLDQDSQDKMYERLFGKRNDDRDRQRDPLADAARGRQPVEQLEPLPVVTVAADRPIETVVVTGRAPSLLPAPSPVPIYSVSPGLAGDLSPFPTPESVPDRAPRPSPSPRPEPVNAPNLQPLPFAPPEAAPVSPAVPRPFTPGTTPGLPASPLAPAPLIGNVIPFPEALPVPKPQLDKCRCNEKKKKKKKPEDRTECWGGTFTEKPRGLYKLKKYRVDCKTGEKISGIVDLRGNPIS